MSESSFDVMLVLGIPNKTPITFKVLQESPEAKCR
jgi:hypothetical protein